MSKFWIEYSDQYKPSPLSSWVHAPVDHEQWLYATEYDPPLPKQVSGKGYAIYKIEVRGWVLEFSSKEEIEHCIDILSNRNLPTTNQLANKSWCKGYQHKHWLTKLPGALKTVKNRMQIVKLLGKVKNQ